MDGMGFLKVIWARRAILVLAVVAAVAAAVPFALMRPARHTARTQVLAPSSDPTAKFTGEVRPSVLSLRLEGYAAKEFETDVRRELGNESTRVLSVRAEPQRNPSYFQIETTATTPELARESAQTAAAVLIARSNEISADLLERLREQVNLQLDALLGQLAELEKERLTKQAEVDGINAEIADLQRIISTAREAPAKARITGAPASSSAAEAEIQVAQAQIDTKNAELQTKQIELGTVEQRQDRIEQERGGLHDLIRAATGAHVSRVAASAVVAPPTVPVAGLPARLLSTLALAMLVGLVIASASIVWLERGRLGAMARSALAPGQRPAARAAESTRLGLSGHPSTEPTIAS